MNLRVYLPTSPFFVTQGWGIYNPAYLKFGFSKHNGMDFVRFPDNREKKFPLWWPVDNCTVYDTDFADATGWRIKANTNDYYDFPDGKHARVNIIMMHMDHKSPIPVGSLISVGTPCGTADNTGFSTGPHTHLMLRRIDPQGNVIDTNEANDTINPADYLVMTPASNVTLLTRLYQQLIPLLSQIKVAINNQQK